MTGCGGCPSPDYCMVAGCHRQRARRPDRLALAAEVIAKLSLLTIGPDGRFVAHAADGRPVYVGTL